MSKKHQEGIAKPTVKKGTNTESSESVTDQKDAKKFTCVMCNREFNVHMNLIAHFR